MQKMYNLIKKSVIAHDSKYKRYIFQKFKFYYESEQVVSK